MYKPMRASLTKKLLTCLFMWLLSTAPITKLLELNFALNELFILRTPIVCALTGCALELYKPVLGHEA
jgi:hypothetical protein